MHELHRILFFFALVIVLGILLRNSDSVVKLENATGKLATDIIGAANTVGNVSGQISRKLPP